MRSSPRSATSTESSGLRRSPSRWLRGRCWWPSRKAVVELDQPVGQPGCTLRHLLAHAGGYGFDGDDAIARPETTRMYSNTGFSLAAQAVEDAAGIAFADYLDEAVFVPLGMTLERAAGFGSARRAVESGRHMPVRRRGDATDADPREHRRRRRTHPLPHAGRYRSRRGSLRAVPLGAGVRSAWHEGTALDRDDQFAADLRALRRVGHHVLDRPRPRPRPRRPRRSRLRPVGRRRVGSVAGTVRCRDRRVLQHGVSG